MLEPAIDARHRFAHPPLVLHLLGGYLRSKADPTMKPKIDGTEFGSITIDGERIEHDVVIRLSGEAADYFAKKKVEVEVALTPAAIARWNRASGATIGLFHVTC
jgi:hypothetical protein